MNEIDKIEQKAINAALSLHWDDAVAANKKILRMDKNNLGAHLRLGFIYLQRNELKEAKKHYKVSLKIQPSHLLAQENLEKIKILEKTPIKKREERELNFNPNLFIEVPGKTKSVLLINPGQKNILAQLTIGEEIYLKPKKRKIEVRTKNNEYLGTLPDDLSKRLLLFLKAGSQYSAFIKEDSLNRVVIFIKEEKKGKRVAKYTSFPKNSQAFMASLTTSQDEEHADGEDEEIVENDLDRLAEILAHEHEDKEFMSYQAEGEEDEENIEE